MNYLYLLALCVAFICCCSADPYGRSTGQPGCKTEEELTVKAYPHFHKKNAYWQCETLNVPARMVICPQGTGFLNDARECVPWDQWYWSPTAMPPSQPTYGGV